MSLVVCPHCGQQVSDNAEACIHCGRILQTKARPKEYADLLYREKQGLHGEFAREYPQYGIYQRMERKAARERRISTITAIFFLVTGAILLILRCTGVSSKIFAEENIVPKFALVGSYLLLVVDFIIWLKTLIAHIIFTHKDLLYKRLFQAWLLKKNIRYRVVFEKKKEGDRRYFENINPDLYLNKGDSHGD